MPQQQDQLKYQPIAQSATKPSAAAYVIVGDKQQLQQAAGRWSALLPASISGASALKPIADGRTETVTQFVSDGKSFILRFMISALDFR